MTTEEVFEFLERIAVCAASLGTDDVRLGVSAPASEHLALVPTARRRATVYRHTSGNRADSAPYVIESVEVRVHGVTIHAQWPSRPATADELPSLEQEQAYNVEDRFVASALRDGDT